MGIYLWNKLLSTIYGNLPKITFIYLKKFSSTSSWFMHNFLHGKLKLKSTLKDDFMGLELTEKVSIFDIPHTFRIHTKKYWELKLFFDNPQNVSRSGSHSMLRKRIIFPLLFFFHRHLATRALSNFILIELKFIWLKKFFFYFSQKFINFLSWK
jgi:hypothetical protein